MGIGGLLAVGRAQNWSSVLAVAAEVGFDVGGLTRVFRLRDTPSRSERYTFGVVYPGRTGNEAGRIGRTPNGCCSIPGTTAEWCWRYGYQRVERRDLLNQARLSLRASAESLIAYGPESCKHGCF